MYSYLIHKGMPIELLLYTCLEEPRKIHKEMIVNGVSRWRYPFHIFSHDDLQSIGLKLHVVDAPYEEIEGEIKRRVELNEVVFILLNSFFMPHREEYRKREDHHWLMITGYDDIANKMVLLDEKYNYYEYYEYGETVIKTAYSNNRLSKIAYFTYSDPDYDKLKDNYIDFFRKFNASTDKFLGAIVPLLEQCISSNNKKIMTERISSAFSFLSGSVNIFKKFLLYIGNCSPNIQHLDRVSKEARIVSSVVKKYELTDIINLKQMEDNIESIRYSFYHFTEYLKSSEFLCSLDTLSLEQIVRNQNSNNAEHVAVNERLHKTKEQIEYVELDLEIYFNNQAFGIKDSLADFTGGGEFFLIEEGNPIARPFHLDRDRIPFLLAQKIGRSKDNISCREQSIYLGKGEYNGIWLLACGEWGDVDTELLLQFEDGLIQEINLQLTDWAWSPKFNERIALSRPIYRREKIDFAPEIGHVFAVYIPLDKKEALNKIILPSCPNLHIFSITLTRARPASSRTSSVVESVQL